MGLSAFDAKLWVFGGELNTSLTQINDVWSSNDGAIWSLENGSPWTNCTGSFGFDIFNGFIIMAGGQTSSSCGTGSATSEVLATGNGSTWISVVNPGSFGARVGHTMTAYNGKLWIVGGSITGSLADNGYSDVWSSTNGSAWTRETMNAGFNRFAHTCVVFNDGTVDKLWLIAGQHGGTSYNDVWCSTDGIVWTLKTSSANFPARMWHSCVVYDGKLWVIGGGPSGGGLADVWYSSDGINWIQSTAIASFGARCGHASVVYNNQMWVVGGKNGTTRLNDVWHSP